MASARLRQSAAIRSALDLAEAEALLEPFAEGRRLLAVACLDNSGRTLTPAQTARRACRTAAENMADACAQHLLELTSCVDERMTRTLTHEQNSGRVKSGHMPRHSHLAA